jgi:hypothetical protein
MTRFSLKVPLFLLPALVLASLAFSATASAETLKPWWHVASGSRPSVIDPQAAGDAVRQLTVGASSGTYKLLASIAGAETKSGALSAGEEPQGVKETIEEMYGAAVEVTAKAGPNNVNEVYEITFVGLEHRPPATMNVQEESLVGGSRSASVRQLVEGRPAGVLVDTVENIGDALASATGSPVRIVDSLPAGVIATGASAITPESNKAGAVPCAVEASGSRVACTFSGLEGELPEGPEESLGGLPPYEYIETRIDVEVQPGSSPNGQPNVVSVSGGGAPAKTVSRPVRVGDEPSVFGLEAFELTPEEAGGALDSRAGSHPFQTGFDLTLNQDIEEGAEYANRPGVRPVALAKDLGIKLPPGLVGNATSIPRCTIGQFLAAVELHNECPADAAVGVATLSYLEPELGGLGFTEKTVPVFNLEPQVGEPARLGIYSTEGHIGIFINTHVRTGGDYGVTSTTSNVDQAVSFISANVSLWGAPGSTAHDSTRGWSCLAASKGYGKEALIKQFGGLCSALGVAHPPAFLSLPTSCTGDQLQASVETDAWQNPGVFTAPLPATGLPTLDGCGKLAFGPEIKVEPENGQASRPAGLKVDVHVPREAESGEGVSASDVRDIDVTMPEGVTLNASAANGLQACSEQLVGYEGSREYQDQPGVSSPAFSAYLPGSTAAVAAGNNEPLAPGVNFCAEQSKIANVAITSPLLPAGQVVKGGMYLASPQNFGGFPAENPFQSLVAMYLVAEDPISGTLVKLPGRVSLNEATGQISASFETNPQLPFEDAKVEFFSGEDAPLASPSKCGTYTTSATFTPWSGGEAVHSSSSYNITSGPGGSPCPGATLPFTPTLQAGTTDNNAGGFGDLSTSLSREDQDGYVRSATLHYPPGVSAILKGVPLCAQAQANAGTCGAGSLIGETTADVGLGNDPFTVTGGKVYLTEGYGGAPFGLSIVTPAKAGPFVLQQGVPVVVRAKIEINPATAAVTVTTGQIPRIIDGFQLELKDVNVLVNRPGFSINPTSCDRKEVTGAVESWEGATFPVAAPFQATNCQNLPFKPAFSATTQGNGKTQGNGASLDVKIATKQGPGFKAGEEEANIAKVDVTLPFALSSRLKTLQKACLETQFAANPAGCPPASMVGTATASTPILPVPLTGPAIIVSHGGRAFPDLDFVLQGDGVEIIVTGNTQIKGGITNTKFETVPDAPVSSFEVNLPEKPNAILGAIKDLCKPTKTVTTKKKVTIEVKGHKRTVTRKVSKTEPEPLIMPTTITGQNGAVETQSTKIAVTGCAKAKVVKKAKKAKKKGKKGGKKQ